GQIIDATIVSVPRQRNTKEENETIKAGKTPEGWEQQPAKNAQKDKDARWTKKNDTSFFGYKNHLGVDKAHKLIRKWDAAGGPEGEGLAEPYPPARRSHGSTPRSQPTMQDDPSPATRSLDEA